jgi:hypothetical protein
VLAGADLPPQVLRPTRAVPPTKPPGAPMAIHLPRSRWRYLRTHGKARPPALDLPAPLHHLRFAWRSRAGPECIRKESRIYVQNRGREKPIHKCPGTGVGVLKYLSKIKAWCHYTKRGARPVFPSAKCQHGSPGQPRVGVGMFSDEPTARIIAGGRIMALNGDCSQQNSSLQNLDH